VHDRNVFFADSNRQHEGPAPCAITPTPQLSNTNTRRQAAQSSC
jgi:hypothetical protein